MKGTLHKTEQGWVVRYNQEDPRDPLPELPLHPEYQTILPLDLDLEGNEVEFDWCVIVDHDTGKGKEYAKLFDKKSEYPELEGTMKLCEEIIKKRTGKMTEEEWQAAEKAQTSKIHSEKEVEQMISDLLDMQDRMVEKAGIINDKLSVLVDYFDANATVEQLIQRYPNDMELGRVIRKQYKTKQNGNS